MPPEALEAHGVAPPRHLPIQLEQVEPTEGVLLEGAVVFRPRAALAEGAMVAATLGTLGDLADLVIETLLLHPREQGTRFSTVTSART